MTAHIPAYYITALKMISILKSAFLALLISIGLGMTPAKAEIITPAEFVMIMDYESGDILYEKNADMPMKPASMAKLMTT